MCAHVFIYMHTLAHMHTFSFLRNLWNNSKCLSRQMLCLLLMWEGPQRRGGREGRVPESVGGPDPPARKAFGLLGIFLLDQIFRK